MSGKNTIHHVNVFETVTSGKETAALLRRASFEGNDYTSAGWNENELIDLYVTN